MSAAERSAGPLLALISFTARCSASRSPVTEARIRAVGPTAMMVIRSDGPSWSMTALTCRLASPRREGDRSVACIDAEASTSTRLCRARAAPAGRAGCNAAATRTAAARSCRKSSQLGRKRCQGTLAWRSRIWLRQRVHVSTLRERGCGEFALQPGLGILEPGVAGPVRHDLLGRQQLEHGAFLLGSLQRDQRPIDRRIAQAVGDHDAQPRPLPGDRPDEALVVRDPADGE